MANYYGFARTNYFHVKDLAAFRAALAPLPIEIVGKGHENEPQAGEPVALLSRDDAGWPSAYWDEEADTDVEVDLPDVIAQHLVDGDVAVAMEIGYEKLRYLIGYGWAVNSKGETRAVNLEDSILELAKQLGTQVTGVDH